jgi:hypothetical protein
MLVTSSLAQWGLRRRGGIRRLVLPAVVLAGAACSGAADPEPGAFLQGRFTLLSVAHATRHYDVPYLVPNALAGPTIVDSGYISIKPDCTYVAELFGKYDGQRVTFVSDSGRYTPPRTGAGPIQFVSPLGFFVGTQRGDSLSVPLPGALVGTTDGTVGLTLRRLSTR